MKHRPSPPDRCLRSLLAPVLLALALAGVGCGGDSRDPRLEEAFDLIKRNQIDEAIAIANAVLTEDPGSSGALNVMGLALYRSGDVEGSVDQYRRALEIEPDYPEAHFNLGNSLRALGQASEAESHYAASVENEKRWGVDKNIVVARYNLGKSYFERGLTEPALAEFRKCVDRDDQFFLAWFDIGRTLYGSGDFEGAIPAFTRYLELDPARKEVRVFLGNSHLQSSAEDRLDRAEEAYRGAIGIDAEYVDAVYSLGVVLSISGRTEEAAAEFGRAYRLTADDPEGQIHQQVRTWFETTGLPMPEVAPDEPPTNGGTAVEG